MTEEKDKDAEDKLVIIKQTEEKDKDAEAKFMDSSKFVKVDFAIKPGVKMSTETIILDGNPERILTSEIE